MKKSTEEKKSLEELAKQQGTESLAQAPSPVEFPDAPAELTPEQKTAAAVKDNLASLEAAKEQPTFTAEALAEKQGKASINPPDAEEAREEAMVQERNRSFRQMMIEGREDAMKRIEEERQVAEAEQKAARMTGLAELGSSLVNLFGVAGGGVSQQYKTYSQDWMQKADQDMRQHRNRVHDLRERQRDAEFKMAQLRQEGERYLAQQRRQRELDNATIKLRQAQTEAQNATTVARMQEAERRANEAEKQLALLQAKIDAQNALAGQRDASGKSSIIRANAQAKNVANQNNNRDKATDSKVNVDGSKIMKNLGQTGYTYDPIKGKYNDKSGISFDENGFPTF